MTDTRPLTWRERERHQLATRQLAEALAAPPVQTALADSARRLAEQAALASGAAEVIRRSGGRTLAAAAALQTAQTRHRLTDAFRIPAMGRLAEQQRVLQNAGTVAAFSKLKLDGTAMGVANAVAWSLHTPAFQASLQAAAQAVVKPTALLVAEQVAGWQRDLFKGLDLGLAARSRFGADVALLSRAVQPTVLQIGETLRGFSRAWEAAGLHGIARTLGRLPLMAALAARDAVLHGDWAALKRFVRQWLGRTPTEPVVQAAAEALLEPDWLPETDLVAPTEVIPHLRARTAPVHARRHKLLGDTQLLGRRLDSLDRPVLLPSGWTAPLVELVPNPRADDDDGDSDERLLRRALAQFDDDERRVLLAKSEGSPTWKAAAEDSGMPPGFGETVRRKRKRVVGELRRRGLA